MHFFFFFLIIQLLEDRSKLSFSVNSDFNIVIYEMGPQFKLPVRGHFRQ